MRNALAKEIAMKAATTFDYGLAKVSDLGITTAQREKSGKSRVAMLEVHGEALAPSPRFWTSFFHRFGISDTVFRYFDHAEVFQRIAERGKSDTVRYCVERDADGRGTLMAVSNPARSVIDHNEASELVSRYGGENVSYANGVITSFHVPRSGDSQFQIGGDEFQHRFVMDTPIDGFGQPKIYLSLLRLICSNGAIGYSPTFRSEIPGGKDMSYCIARALESYDNGDGYAALRQRFESAQKSWASLYECHQLYKCVIRLADQRMFTRESILSDFYQVTGNANSIYGLANLDALTTKRQRVLPARCRVYDLINFASELATHHVRPGGNRTLQAYIGTLISDEFDMEGTAERLVDFNDFFVSGSEGMPRESVN
jgi:hypothetical protein